MQVSERHYSEPVANKTIRVAIVTALFNEKITCALATAAETELRLLKVNPEKIIHLTVPGAWELALASKKILAAKKADAVIAVGCVIRGDTGHYDIVANESASGLTQVSLEFSKPVMNAVLTVENITQAEARSRADSTNKGAEAARSLVELINSLEAAGLKI